MLDLSTFFLGRPLTAPLMNASGVWCNVNSQLHALAESEAGAMVTKSCTLLRRDGNPEPRYHTLTMGSINSMGLSNEGHQYYLDYAERHDYENKPLFFSVAGLTLDDNLTIVAQIQDAYTPALLELNLSCPNVPGKAQIAYDFDALDVILAEISSAYSRPFGVKLPPYFDIAHFDEVADILNRYEKVNFITCINSIGNGLMIDMESETVLIKPKQGFGGIGGEYVLPTALANVNAFHQRCPKKSIIGCGGVNTGEHVFMHLLAGASIVQVGTALYEQGPDIFVRLKAELAQIMQEKGYKTIREFQGKLKTL